MVEIQHEKLGAKLHTDTFSYVKTCTRTRPCKSIHLCRGTSFYSEDVSQSLVLSQTNVLSHGFLRQKLYAEKSSEVKVVWWHVALTTPVGS